MFDKHTTLKLYSWLRKVFWVTTGCAVLSQLFFIPFFRSWPVIAGFVVYTILLVVLNARLKSHGVAWHWLALALLLPAIGYLISFAVIERSMAAFTKSHIDGGAQAIGGGARISTTRRIVGLGATCCVLAIGGVVYSTVGIRANATDCLIVTAVATARQLSPLNPTVKQSDLRDAPLEAVARCTEQRNSVFENMFFDRADIGRYIRLGRPAP
ncbi:MAG: hypothetical protein C0449_00260 [Polaromonas sp.]|nr:hypothetical protein [Polaromonas sp.]